MADELSGVRSSRHPLATTLGVGLVCAVGLGLIEATSVYAMRASADRDTGWPFALAMTLPSWLLFALLSPAIVGLARRFSFERDSWVASTAVHATAGLLLSLAHLAVVAFTYTLLREEIAWDRFERVFVVCFRYMFMLELLAYWAIVGLYLTVRASNLRTSLAEARLTALRTQLNPHFLFNTLHAISVLSLKGEDKAVAEMLGRLSDLLRAALDSSAQEIPLAIEMDFVDHYMELQRIRFADRLAVEKAIAPETLGGLVPTMILQPIVENAIKYGISSQRGRGRVDIRASREGNELIVEISDSGPGFPSSGPREGIGLANTRARLEQLYGSRHRLECNQGPAGGAAVRIVIPFRQSAA